MSVYIIWLNILFKQFTTQSIHSSLYFNKEAFGQKLHIFFSFFDVITKVQPSLQTALCNLVLVHGGMMGTCHTRLFTGSHFQEENPFTFEWLSFLGIVRHRLKNHSCTAEVVLQHALQLVASKLPGKVASCDKALRLQKLCIITIFSECYQTVGNMGIQAILIHVLILAR